MSGDIAPAKLEWGPRAAVFFHDQKEPHSMKTKLAQTAFAESKMNQISLLNRANVFEAGLFSWGIPEETARELTRQHTELNYSSGKLIFSQGSPADIVLCVVKGVV